MKTETAHASFSGQFWFAEPEHAVFIKPWIQACQLSCLAFLLAQLLGGVVRWVLDMVGAAALTYIPNLLMLGCVASMLALDMAHQRTSRSVVFLALLLSLSVTVGYFNTGHLAQVIFGVWVLTPFFFGLVSAPTLMRTNRYSLWILMAVFALAAGGVLGHNFIAYPWVGVSYSVGGVELEGAREWQTTGGAQRLSGLARSSFDVAGQILTAAALLALQVRSGPWRTFIWVLAVGAISLSTSKGILLALLMTAGAVEGAIRQKAWILRTILVLGMLWMFVPPLMGWTMDWSQESRTDLENPLYGSFIDRMNDMWPRAWQLAVDHGLPPLGRGMGGIGVPVSIFESNLANAGDNLFVYCLVLVGILSVPLFVAGFIALFRLCNRLHLEVARQTLVIAVTVNWYGGVSNILEHAFMAFGFGMVCRVLVAELAGTQMEGPRPADAAAPRHGAEAVDGTGHGSVHPR